MCETENRESEREKEWSMVRARDTLWKSESDCEIQTERETERQNTKQAAYNVVFEKIFIFKNPIV